MKEFTTSSKLRLLRQALSQESEPAKYYLIGQGPAETMNKCIPLDSLDILGAYSEALIRLGYEISEKALQ